MKPRALKWETLDWRLPNAVLSKRHNVHHKTVSKWRKRLSQPRSANPIRRVKGFIDWNLSNLQLARKHAASRKYFENRRKREAQETSLDPNLTKPINSLDWSIINWNERNAVIARQMSCSENTVRRARMRHGRPNEHTKKEITYEEFLKSKRVATKRR